MNVLIEFNLQDSVFNVPHALCLTIFITRDTRVLSDCLGPNVRPAEAKGLPLWHAKQHPSRDSHMELVYEACASHLRYQCSCYLLHSFLKNKGNMQSDLNNSPAPADRDASAAEEGLSAGRPAAPRQAKASPACRLTLRLKGGRGPHRVSRWTTSRALGCLVSPQPPPLFPEPAAPRGQAHTHVRTLC